MLYNYRLSQFVGFQSVARLIQHYKTELQTSRKFINGLKIPSSVQNECYFVSSAKILSINLIIASMYMPQSYRGIPPALPPLTRTLRTLYRHPPLLVAPSRSDATCYVPTHHRKPYTDNQSNYDFVIKEKLQENEGLLKC